MIQEGAPSSETQKFNFKLDKYDEFGRTLTPKEAFRELCWKFHGKAPGAKAKEKRLRKYEEEQAASCEMAMGIKEATRSKECKQFKNNR